jgi:predicted amidophosphoribosyltransferase
MNFELLLYWVSISGTIGALIGSIKGNMGLGVLLALLLGPVGWLLICFVPDKRRKCPQCAGALPDAKVARCKHCGSLLSSAGMSGPPQAFQPGSAADPIDAWEERESSGKKLPPLGTTKRPWE